jgi:Co/Zn/Cd efflux system component
MGEKVSPSERRSAHTVAVILAAGMAVALNVVTVSLLYVALLRLGNPAQVQGISERGTVLLTGWGGGIIGVLGAYIGYAFGRPKQSQYDADSVENPQ